MFSFSRYLPLGRQEPATPEPPEQHEDVDQDPPSRSRDLSGVQMVVLRRGGFVEVPVVYPMPEQVPADTSPIGSLPPEFFQDAYDLEEEEPTPQAVAAVRLCSWLLFVIGFMFLFQRQQEHEQQMNRRVTIQNSGKLRMSQIYHMQLPWVHVSGLDHPGSRLAAHFIDSNSTTFSVFKVSNTNNSKLTAKRHGTDNIHFERPMKAPLRNETKQFDTTNVQGSEESMLNEQNLVFLDLSDENDELIRVRRSDHSTGEYTVLFADDSTVSFNLPSDFTELLYFKILANTKQIVAVVSDRNRSFDGHCLVVFNTTRGEPTCEHTRSLHKASAYFFDSKSKHLVSVGLDDYSKDGTSGYSLHGVFIESTAITDTPTHHKEFAVSIPYIHKANEGLWVFQNHPVTEGFVVLVPSMGYPQTPVQHVVSLHQGMAAEFSPGAVFRMESAAGELYRRIETIRYNAPVNDLPGCACPRNSTDEDSEI